MEGGRETILRAQRLVDAIGAELAVAPFARQTQPGSLPRIPPPSEAEAERRSSLARGWRDDLAAVDREALPADWRRLLAIADATIERLEREAAWYWLVHDPLGLGFFGLFGPTAYCGGWYMGVVGGLMARQELAGIEEGERYLARIEELGAAVTAMTDRLRGQAARGIAMPAEQRDRAVVLLAAAGPRLIGQVRVGKRAGGDLRRSTAVDMAVAQYLSPALDELAEAVTTAPVARTLGMTHLPGGAAVYAELVRHHTTLDLGPEEVHALGVERLAGIRERMAALRGEAGFRGDDAAFAACLAADADLVARDAMTIEAAFERVLGRVRPRLDGWFRSLPAAGFGAAPLPAALEAGMTFGIYQAAAVPDGGARYLFNTANLLESGLSRVPALAFHELVPGHHVHLGGQAEDDGLSQMVRYNSFNAFNEGWAEYAATLAEEEGLYVGVGERFGRLQMDAFLTARLVADTGVNACGWSLERTRAFLAEQAFMSARESASEAVRYAADLPGQVLAYKLGDTHLLRERERMRQARGPAFDLRDFHELVLAPGARPLPLVTADVDSALR